jgi:hypothetical protein
LGLGWGQNVRTQDSMKTSPSLRGVPHRGDVAISQKVLLFEIATSDASSQWA